MVRREWQRARTPFHPFSGGESCWCGKEFLRKCAKENVSGNQIKGPLPPLPQRKSIRDRFVCPDLSCQRCMLAQISHLINMTRSSDSAQYIALRSSQHVTSECKITAETWHKRCQKFSIQRIDCLHKRLQALCEPQWHCESMARWCNNYEMGKSMPKQMDWKHASSKCNDLSLKGLSNEIHIHTLFLILSYTTFICMPHNFYYNINLQTLFMLRFIENSNIGQFRM